MAEISCVYELDVANLIFNAPTGDTYWLTAAPKGLDGAPIRRDKEVAAQADGGLEGLPQKYGAREITFVGRYLPRTGTTDAEKVAIRNQLALDLRLGLEAIFAADDTLTWTPTGLTEHTLTKVRYDSPLDDDGEPGTIVHTFVFGLWTPDPTIAIA